MLLPQFAFAQKLYMGDPLITAPGTYYGPYKYHALALQSWMFVTKLNSGPPPPNEVIYPDFDSFYRAHNNGQKPPAGCVYCPGYFEEHLQDMPDARNTRPARVAHFL
ncbi:hypothetical protein GUITHDRAFT_99647 [Guillardia theta CCMP2712]|uniref:Uncharacterized protein n=1 Tax=Guillardia theta (strain CCMP2712) TaxID=905079 RepID=L1K2F1_GUITC|nr:hypothetical protein GUITHDRAFT_99647 [Guillardia theta CCMP2712]EKX55006.1 hypothetical protein GUITHDRAFT_99647 [Guillardia theta CCMP2712]|eukprot:XP_005841986.1 hypothetical protein GUITHDRAFT_99647 [Guillardia theta CCMP2712]